MKAVFLDIDGVLASFDYIRITHLLKGKVIRLSDLPHENCKERDANAQSSA